MITRVRRHRISGGFGSSPVDVDYPFLMSAMDGVDSYLYGGTSGFELGSVLRSFTGDLNLWCVRVLNGMILAATDSEMAYSTSGDPYTFATVANPSSGEPVDAALGGDGSIHVLFNASASPAEIFRSTDGGATWGDVTPGSMDVIGFNLSMVRGVGGELAVVSGSGNDYNAAYSSGGVTWSREAAIITVAGGAGLSALGYDPDGNRYVIAVSDGSGVKLFLGSAAGAIATATWAEAASFATAYGSAGFTAAPFRTAVSPAGAILVACADGSLYSDDGGTTWNDSTFTSLIAPPHTVYWSARVGAFVASGNNGSSEGVALAYNSGTHSWAAITAAPNASFLLFGAVAEFPQP